jgi:hypothetical protein
MSEAEPTDAQWYSTLATFANGELHATDAVRKCARLALERVKDLTYQHEECEPAEGSRLWRCEKELEKLRASALESPTSLLTRLTAVERELSAAKAALQALGTRVDTPDAYDNRGRRTPGKNQSCCDPHFIKRDEKGKPTGWTITLNEYQRANLLWLLCDVMGYDGEGVDAMRVLGTGDWAGEVPNALRLNERGEMEKPEMLPNSTLEAVRASLGARSP